MNSRKRPPVEGDPAAPSAPTEREGGREDPARD